MGGRPGPEFVLRGELLAVGARGMDLGVGRRAAQTPDPGAGGDPRGGVGVGEG